MDTKLILVKHTYIISYTIHSWFKIFNQFNIFFYFFSFSIFQLNQKQPKPSPCLKDQDSPSPWSSQLTLLISSARRKPPEPNASSNCGLTSRRTTSKIQKTNNSSPQTKRWPRFSAVTASVPSVWPNSFHPTSKDKFVTYTRKDLCEPALSSPIILQLNILLKNSTRRG